MTVSPVLRLPAEVSIALGKAAPAFEDWLQITLRTGVVASELGPELSARFDRLDTGLARTDADIVKLRSDVDGVRTEVGELRADVAELRGQVTILNTTTSGLGDDMRALRTDLNQRFDSLRTDMDQRFDSIGTRFDSMGARFDDRIDRSTRWSVGLLALFGTMVTVLLGFATLRP